MHDMEMPYLSSGAPWMMEPPASLAADRTASYDLTEEQIQYVTQYWLFWYEADRRYGLPTIAFFLSTILFFTFTAAFSRFAPKSIKDTNLVRRVTAASRLLSYKGWKISALGWYSPPAGVWVLGGIGAIFFFSMTLGPKPYYWPNTETVNFGNSPPIATRTGWMSIACLPFLLVLAAKENPISLLTRVPYEKLMVFHKWVAWAMYVLALIHTFPFIIHHVWKGDMYETWTTDVFYWTGVVALSAQTWLQFMSFGPIRNRFYEFFKVLHYAMAALFFAFLFIHCYYTLTSWDYLIAAAVIYTVCLVVSQLRVWFEHGISSHATIETAESGAVKVSIPTTSPWYPGQHIFVRFMIPSLQGLTSHPFTICSLPITKDNVSLPDVDPDTADMVFYIWPYHGLTGRLSAIAKKQPNKKIRVLLDGPYGGMRERSLHSFDHAMVIGGGSGAGFTLPVIENFLRMNFANRKQISAKANQLHIVVAFKTEEYRSWYLSAFREMLQNCDIPSDTTAIKLDIHITNAQTVVNEKAETLEQGNTSGTSSNESESYVTVFRGERPHLPDLIKNRVQNKEKSESIGVAVCGPSSMLYDVRNAVADAQLDVLRQGSGEIWLYNEHFGW